jgi:hypothetical protein
MRGAAAHVNRGVGAAYARVADHAQIRVLGGARPGELDHSLHLPGHESIFGLVNANPVNDS